MLQGKNVLVVGTGISGVGAVTLLHKMNAVIGVYDGNEKLTKEEVFSKMPEGVEVRV